MAGERPRACQGGVGPWPLSARGRGAAEVLRDSGHKWLGVRPPAALRGLPWSL